MAPITPLRKPLHHLRSNHRTRPTISNSKGQAHSAPNFIAEAAKHLASNAPNQADPNDNRGFRGNQSRLEEDEEKRKRDYLVRLRNMRAEHRQKLIAHLRRIREKRMAYK